ncbi:MAG: 2-C-methyl-D-erythritol 2,4-cyclodiphosphate synthase [Alphaproteobacteria bacterium]|uniref:2-C-methyl-D-erythritol 2,4-cyclodiphosphate synthase n=1 Tax=Candidatus Nitrobium versatile TaxID=2884831 RepID=A0A953LVU0_9BACT|nr:2-C-methyl-D-erythritol 2,4-cyclodiphosphate synthase [Candidatus Nitrobium versatile]
MRIGIGYDSHRLVEGRKLILGGVDIPHEKGLLGHSDGDALCHAVTDALIGALGEGDIGKHFPDTDPQWKGVSSILLLKHIAERVKERGFEIAWIDSIIIAERPKIGPHIDSMKHALSAAGIPPACVSIKAKTNEGMGFAGRGEGIAVHAVCLLVQSSL